MEYDGDRFAIIYIYVLTNAKIVILPESRLHQEMVFSKNNIYVLLYYELIYID